MSTHRIPSWTPERTPDRIPGETPAPAPGAVLDRAVAALVLDAEAVTDAAGAAGVAPLRRRIERLLAAGVDVALVTGRPPAGTDGLTAPGPHAPGRLSVRAAGPDGAGYRDAVAELHGLGVAPDAVALVVGDVDGTRAALGRLLPGAVLAADGDLAGVLDDQLWRRAGLRVPAVADVPGWSVVEAVSPGAGAGPRDALLTVGDGAFATRGGLEEVPDAATVLGSGVWAAHGPDQHLLPGPGWTGLDLAGAALGGRRMLDLRAGVLLREDGAPPGAPLRTLRYASAARPGLHVLRAEGPAARFSAGPALRVPALPGTAAARTGRDGIVTWAAVPGARGWFVAAAVQSQADRAGHRTVQRFAVHRAGPDPDAALADAVAAVRDAQLAGFERVLAEHRRVWEERWRDADVEVPADPAAQLALRFALFQLWVNAGWAADGSLGDEQAVGARGLSGPGYAGHVFWDADVFVLPALATFAPAAARAMLQYRIRRLPQARALAAASGRAGARFPWESAGDGVEVTPASVVIGGEPVPVLTGEQEEHITADVAWAADRYAAWTGDAAFLTGAGRPLVVETARYWASRVRLDEAGRGHVEGVIGPDEYHEAVDDDVFTNVMARWNLRRGADLLGPDDAEGARWRALADALVDGHDPVTGRHEQFRGYLALEPLDAADVAPVPFGADHVLGVERVRATQLVKQPDVLMAHFLVPEELPAGSLGPDLDTYVRRTSHGSSLSPAVTAAVLARAGRPDEALDTFRTALRLDLDDVTGTGGKGLHVATLGGVWQALLVGFLGLRVVDGVLSVDPRLPAAWPRLTARMHVLGARVRVTADAAGVLVVTDRPVRVTAPGYRPVRVAGEVLLDRG